MGIDFKHLGQKSERRCEFYWMRELVAKETAVLHWSGFELNFCLLINSVDKPNIRMDFIGHVRTGIDLRGWV